MNLDNRSLYYRWREKIRLNSQVARLLYLAQSLKHANTGAFRRQVVRARRRAGARGTGVALCCRIRDEGRYLREFVEFYRAAGVEHFFFYEKLSLDNFREVLAPYIESGLVSLFEDWPHVPVSPSAEHDCILRSIGRFEWVGFIDADEFVVVKDGRSIGEFLSGYPKSAGVALHWWNYGSNGHKKRPNGPVIVEYDRRERAVNRHVKVFVRPDLVAACRNSHSWYFQRMRVAVNEQRRAVYGSISQPVTAEHAWINHYHHKSDEDYFEKAKRKSVLDTVGIRYQNRTLERHNATEQASNEVLDQVAIEYYRERCRAAGLAPVLLQQPSSAMAGGVGHSVRENA